MVALRWSVGRRACPADQIIVVGSQAVLATIPEFTALPKRHCGRVRRCTTLRSQPSGQSTRLVARQLVFRDDGRVEETDPPDSVPADEVIVLQPYGALFFATASTLLEQVPSVTPESRNSVVILRIRGADDAGATLIDIVTDYAASLSDADSKLIIVTGNRNVIRQLRVTGATDVIGADNIYRSPKFIGETTRRAHDEAWVWVDDHRQTTSAASPPEQNDDGSTTLPSDRAEGERDEP